jgi:uncharacterized protein (TIGR03083 family)
VLDHAHEYRQLRTRVVDLVRGCDTVTLDSTPPATPGWRVRDLLAHLSGVCADIVNGNLDGVTTDPWTAAQVDTRRDWPTEQLLDEWEEQGSKVEGVIRGVPDLPDWNTFLFDAATHEQDLRGALGVPGARDTEPIVWLVANMLDGIGQRLRNEGGGSIRFQLGDGITVAGDGEPVTTITTTRFELFRAATGRRSLAQLQAYGWDPEPRPQYLVTGPLFHPRATDLVE